MTNSEKHRQESILGVDAWVETGEHSEPSEGFAAAAHFLAGDETPSDEPHHKASQEEPWDAH